MNPEFVVQFPLYAISIYFEREVINPAVSVILKGTGTLPCTEIKLIVELLMVTEEGKIFYFIIVYF